MANLSTTDAVLTEFFDTDKVCDKLELATNINGQHIRNLAKLQVKHGAGTDFKDSDLPMIWEAFREYLHMTNKANMPTTNAVLTAFFAASGLYSKIAAAKNINGYHIRRMNALKSKFDAGTDFTMADRNDMYVALWEYLNNAI